MIKDRVKQAFRNTPERSTRRYVDRRYRSSPRPYYRRGYRDGYHYGYHSGFSHGYHSGYHYGHYYLHNHYYGPHLVFGYHYGGFGFYSGRWHFAIVIGEPVLVSHHHHHYYYSWWDGRSSNLVSWDRVVETRGGNYAFAAGTCVELWLQTRDGTDYVVKADPRQWDAQDPGELYAALWGELEREGQLQIEDVNGALHVFPAGMIQQIEARACN